MSPHDLLTLRIEAITGLHSAYTPLAPEQIDSLSQRLRLVYLSEMNQVGSQLRSHMRRIDMADFDSAQVRHTLAALGIPADEQSYLMWPADNAGIIMAFGDFAQYYDDLWYPARDDLWVTNSDLSWFLSLDHEEIATFFRKL